MIYKITIFCTKLLLLSSIMYINNSCILYKSKKSVLEAAKIQVFSKTTICFEPFIRIGTGETYQSISFNSDFLFSEAYEDSYGKWLAVVSATNRLLLIHYGEPFGPLEIKPNVSNIYPALVVDGIIITDIHPTTDAVNANIHSIYEYALVLSGNAAIKLESRNIQMDQQFMEYNFTKEQLYDHYSIVYCSQILTSMINEPNIRKCPNVLTICFEGSKCKAIGFFARSFKYSKSSVMSLKFDLEKRCDIESVITVLNATEKFYTQ